jgi:hypothetical protein
MAGRFEISEAVLESIQTACGLSGSVLANHDALEVQHAA